MDIDNKYKFKKYEFGASAGVYPGIMIGIRSYQADVELEEEETGARANYVCYTTNICIPFFDVVFDIMVRQY